NDCWAIHRISAASGEKTARGPSRGISPLGAAARSFALLRAAPTGENAATASHGRSCHACGCPFRPGPAAWTNLAQLRDFGPKMAGGLGFEPRPAESESAVLPLDDPPRYAGPPPGRDAPRSCDHLISHRRGAV